MKAQTRRLRGACATLAVFALLGSSSAYAGPIIGGATLLDPAIVHAGTVVAGATLAYVSGGNGATGTADGTSFAGTVETSAAAMAGIDHHWLQYDPGIIVFSAIARSAVLAIPAIDHGWAADNSGEFWEPFEFQIFGCTSALAATCLDAGVITDVWARGVDDAGAMKNGDDWTTRWAFGSAHNYFMITSGDRLVGGPYSAGEGEIDALAAVPEPVLLSLLGLGLAGLARRRRAS